MKYFLLLVSILALTYCTVSEVITDVSVVSVSSLSDMPLLLKDNIVDGDILTGWRAGSANNEYATFNLSCIKDISEVTLHRTNKKRMKDTLIQVSDGPMGPWTTHHAFQVPKTSTPHTETFPSVLTQYVRIFVKNTWGTDPMVRGTCWIGIAEAIFKGMNDCEGEQPGIVSDPMVIGFSSIAEDPIKDSAMNALDHDVTTCWKSGSRMNEFIIIDAKCEIHLVGFTIFRNNYKRIREAEWYKCSDALGNSCTLVKSFQATKSSIPYPVSFSSTVSRYWKLLIKNTYGTVPGTLGTCYAGICDMDLLSDGVCVN